MVDVIDGGHSGGDMTSDFLILLLRASDTVLKAYGKKLKDELWLRHGNIRDLNLTAGSTAHRVASFSDLSLQLTPVSCYSRERSDATDSGGKD